MNRKIVLITGASGLIGTTLSLHLLDLGHEVRRLSSNKDWVRNNGQSYYWNIEQGIIDNEAIKDVDFLINLSGTSIAQGLWTKKRKNKILDSRVKGSRLLFETFQMAGIQLKAYFGASAIGYYGSGANANVFDESSPKGSGFLSDVCHLWEKEHVKFKEISNQVTIGRISNVISPKGGFMLPFRKISPLGLKLFMGNRQHYCSWIHINDLIAFISGVPNLKIDGTYNLCTGHSDWYKFQDEFYNHSGKHFIRITIPTFLLKLLMGEMSTLITDGNRVSGSKLRKSGFENLNDILPKVFN